jgi:hypothetical protein
VVREFNHMAPRYAGSKAATAKSEVLCANCHQRHTIIGREAHYRTVPAAVAPRWRRSPRSSSSIREVRMRNHRCAHFAVRSQGGCAQSERHWAVCLERTKWPDATLVVRIVVGDEPLWLGHGSAHVFA